MKTRCSHIHNEGEATRRRRTSGRAYTPKSGNILGSLYIRKRRPAEGFLGILEQFDAAGYAYIAFA
jgi:hypothetical protein